MFPCDGKGPTRAVTMLTTCFIVKWYKYRLVSNWTKIINLYWFWCYVALFVVYIILIYILKFWIHSIQFFCYSDSNHSNPVKNMMCLKGSYSAISVEIVLCTMLYIKTTGLVASEIGCCSNIANTSLYVTVLPTTVHSKNLLSKWKHISLKKKLNLFLK